MTLACGGQGLADPSALVQAVAADQAVHAIGMPEAGVVIAQCVVYLALAPKSCAVYRAFEQAMHACRDEPHADVPLHIRNAPTAMMRGLGYGDGYVYNPANGYVRGHGELGYLPAELGAGRAFFDAHDCETGHTLHFVRRGRRSPSGLGGGAGGRGEDDSGGGGDGVVGSGRVLSPCPSESPTY